MRLIITRHGETVDNLAKIIQGQAPGKLTEKGVHQAKLLGKRLIHENIDIIYCSDLERAHHTAKEIHHSLPTIQIITTTLLRERNMGNATGKEQALIDWDENDPSRENNRQLLERAEAFLYMISDKHSKKTVLLVSHGRIALAMFAVLEGRDDIDISEKHLDNTAISVYEVSGTKGVPLLENCTKHLTNL